MLTLDNIQIDLGGQTIVENFSLHLAAGECLALSGASGCGKTTILRAIAGLVALEDGSIRCHARRLAYLFQEPRLLPWLRADENVRLVAPEADTARIRTLFRELWLDDKDLRKYPHELSGGMQQRVALARAFVVEPAVLLADEPTGSLDFATGQEIIAQLFALNQAQGCTLVLVTHDRNLAQQCQRQITVQAGRLA